MTTVLYEQIAAPADHPLFMRKLSINSERLMFSKTLLFSALIAPPVDHTELPSNMESVIVVVEDFKLIAPP